MSTTTDPLLFPKQVALMFQNSMEQGFKDGAHILWSALMTFLAQHWVLVILGLFVSFVFVTIKAGLGRWGSLGSFLYNFFYFGILLIVGLIRGPEVFLSNYFDVFTAIILYPFCYWLSGWLMDKMGVRKKY